MTGHANPTITAATSHDRARALETIVTAFERDPFLRLAFPDDDYYAECAPGFFGALFDQRVGRGTVWVAEGGAAVAMWDAPGAPAVVDDTSGLSAASCAVLEAYDRSVHAAMPTAAHWYLGVLATDPARHGQGLARAVLERGLLQAASDGLPAVLETTNPGNLEIYRRLGWQVIAEATEPLPIWILQAGG